MNLRNLVRWYGNPLVIGGAILIALLLFAITFASIWLTRPESTPPGKATAMLNVLRVPTATPVLPTPTLPAGLTPTVNDGAGAPGNIAVGTYVEISGTGGDGLRLRSEAGLAGQIQFIAPEGLVFLVADGPNETDGYIWWYLTGVENEMRTGWAVSDFMVITDTP